jgi:hypothetical protein
MKKINILETECKYVVHLNSNIKSGVWNREFIIYQWYHNQSKDFESKYKLIIDWLNLTYKFVIVEKRRIDSITSNKTVTYLNMIDFQKLNFIDVPFILKRRSILGNLHLDKFIHSNNKCQFLLEIEEPDNDIEIPEEITIFEDVSTDVSYRNVNMTIPYEKTHKIELEFLLKVI